MTKKPARLKSDRRRTRGHVSKWSVSIPKHLASRVDAYCDRWGLTRSAFIAAVLADSLDDGQDDSTQVAVLATDSVRMALLEALRKPGVLDDLERALGDPITEEQRAKAREVLGR